MVDWLDHAGVTAATSEAHGGASGGGPEPSHIDEVTGGPRAAVATTAARNTTTAHGTEQRLSDQEKAGPVNASPSPSPPPAPVALSLPSAPTPAPTQPPLTTTAPTAPKSRKRMATGPPVATREKRPRAAKNKKVDYRL